MRVNLARVVVLVAGLVGLFTAAMPAAEADAVGSIWFRGNADVNGGSNTIAYPCIGGLPGSLTVDMSLCPGPGSVSTKPKMISKHSGKVVVYVETSHNQSTIDLTTKTCIGAVANHNKLNKTAADAGSCGIAGSGTVWGYCGLSTGTVSGAIATTTNVYAFTVKVTGVGGVLKLTGFVTLQTSVGWVSGVVTVFPDPQQGSCLNNHRLGFIVWGGAKMLIDS